jgi:hypothetical protein
MSDHHDNPLDERDLDLLEEMGYEPSDEPAASPVGKYTALFFAFFALMVVVSFGFLQVVGRIEGFDIKQNRERQLMPPKGTPLLQSNVTAQGDMVQIRKDEVAKLSGYAPIPEEGRFKIPVDKAMEIVVKRGLPTKAGAEVPKVMK